MAGLQSRLPVIATLRRKTKLSKATGAWAQVIGTDGQESVGEPHCLPPVVAQNRKNKIAAVRGRNSLDAAWSCFIETHGPEIGGWASLPSRRCGQQRKKKIGWVEGQQHPQNYKSRIRGGRFDARARVSKKSLAYSGRR